LQSRGIARLVHRARDGATVTGLQSQAQGLHVEGRGIALITIGQFRRRGGGCSLNLLTIQVWLLQQWIR
jgi:hypothetical protein